MSKERDISPTAENTNSAQFRAGAPLLPEYEAAANSLFFEIVHVFMRAQDPVLDNIGGEQVRHLAEETAPLEVAEGAHSKPMAVSFIAELSHESLLTIDTEAWASAAWDAATRALAELMPQFFASLEKIITDHGGATVSGGGGPFTWDLAIEGLEKMHVDFDAHGTAANLAFVVSPDVADKMKATPMTPAQAKRWDDVMQRKKEEFDARRRRRRLD